MMELSKEAISFIPVSLEKHNRPSFIIQPIKIQRFEDPLLDPVLHIRTYIKLTICSLSHLFVITRSHYEAAAKATISGWISSAISSSGQKGSGGSVRSVASSKVANGKGDLHTILEA